MTESKTPRIIRWVILNGCLLLALWLAVHGNEGARRVIVFASWFFAIVSVLVVPLKEVQERIRKQGRSVPAWLSHGVGYVMVVTMVWQGWVWAGFAMLLNELVEYAVYAAPSEEKATDSTP